MEGQINKRVTIILSVWIILLFTWIGGIVYINEQIEQSYQDSIYYYKVMQSPTRLLNYSPITQDTAFIRKLEEDTKKLLK